MNDNNVFAILSIKEMTMKRIVEQILARDLVLHKNGSFVSDIVAIQSHITSLDQNVQYKGEICVMLLPQNVTFSTPHVTSTSTLL